MKDFAPDITALIGDDLSAEDRARIMAADLLAELHRHFDRRMAARQLIPAMLLAECAARFVSRDHVQAVAVLDAYLREWPK